MLFSSAIAAATPDQVFKSLGESMDASVNPNHILLIVVGLIGLLVLISMFNRRIEKKDKPKPLNNPSRLMRQLARQVGLSNRELRQLKVIAEQENLQNPLVLLLCPSVLQRVAKERKTAKK
jgi:hypothetical protein